MPDLVDNLMFSSVIEQVGMTTELPCIICLRFSLLLPVYGIMGEGVRCSEPSGAGDSFAQKLRPVPFYPIYSHWAFV